MGILSVSKNSNAYTIKLISCLKMTSKTCFDHLSARVGTSHTTVKIGWFSTKQLDKYRWLHQRVKRVWHKVLIVRDIQVKNN